MLIETQFTYVDDVYPACCFIVYPQYEPCRPQQSCLCPHLSSALIRYLIIDCGQLVKSSSCFGGPPRPPVTRLLYCTSLYRAHEQGKRASLPTAHRSRFPVCNSFCCGSAGKSEVHAVTLGDSETQRGKKSCSSFSCEENEPRKITTSNCFMKYFMSESASSIYKAVNSMHIFHHCEARMRACGRMGMCVYIVERWGVCNSTAILQCE